MTGRDFEWLCKRYVLPQFPQWVCRGGWLVESTARLVLCAVRLNPSAFSKDDFGLKVVALPLYAITVPPGMWEVRGVDPPKDAGFYTWSFKRGDRPSAERVGEAVIQAVREDVIPWCGERDDPARLLASLKHGATHWDTEPGLARISALSAAAMGDCDEARRIIAKHDSRWRGTQHDDDPVVNEVRHELRGWLDTIESGPEAVRRRILEASKQGLRDLKLNSQVVLQRPDWWPADQWDV